MEGLPIATIAARRRGTSVVNEHLGSQDHGSAPPQSRQPPRVVATTRLLQSTADDPSQAAPAWTDTIVEANEQLILTSLHAQELAQNAVHDLDELTRATQHDALTGIPNRALLLDRLEHAIAVATRNASHVAVLFIDLDNFKQVNDSLGHDVGDEVLQAAARRLEAAVRGSDTVSRHGGDEFLVLLSEISHASDAVLIAHKMLAAFVSPIRAGDDLVFVSASIGIAIYPEDGADASGLIHGADTAMYQSKRRGPGGYAFHGDAVSKLHAADVSDRSPRAVKSPTASRLEERLRQEQEKEQERITQELREANANLIAAAVRVAQEREVPAAPTSPQLALQAVVATKLRSPFTARKEAVWLLTQVHTSEPLLQVLIEKQIAHLSAPHYESFAGPPQTESLRFKSHETQKTGQFEAAAEGGARYEIIEFTVTTRFRAMDETRRASRQKAYGLRNGDRIERVGAYEFRIVTTGTLLRVI